MTRTGWSARVPFGTLAAAVGILVVPNVVGDFHLYTLTLGLTYLIAVVGLNLLLGFGGVISLGTGAFIMLGAYSAGVAQNVWDLPFWLGAPIAMVVCAVAGLLTVMPVLRLGAFAVAVVTLAYLTVITSLIDIYPSLTGGGEGLAVRRSGASPTELWFVFAVIAAVVYVAVANLMRSPYGRALNLSRLSPLLSQSLGSSPNGLKIAAFTIAASLAGLAGALYPVLNGRVSTANFTVWLSILLLLMVVLGGQGTVAGPFLGTALLTLVPIVLDKIFHEGGNIGHLVYGIFLLITVLVAPHGMAGVGAQLRQLLARWRASSPSPAREAAATDETEDSRVAVPELLLAGRQPDALTVRGLTKHIGGITALHDVDVEVRAGTVHGLIGPNGSGKTTFLNCVSGFYGTDAGEIRVSDEPVPSRPSARARGGLGRTFQQPLLLDQLSALDNVWVGVDRHRKVGWLGYVLRTPAARREAREARTEAQRWLEAVGLGADRDTPAGRLGPGKARLVEVARALATQPRVLLMDEPAAGLSDAEMEHLEAVIREVRSAGITVVLVDHHANLVLGLCDQITVLASGQVIASGTPEEVRHDAVVINTYLGRRFLGADPEPLNA